MDRLIKSFNSKKDTKRENCNPKLIRTCLSKQIKIFHINKIITNKIDKICTNTIDKMDGKCDIKKHDKSDTIDAGKLYRKINLVLH